VELSQGLRHPLIGRCGGVDNLKPENQKLETSKALLDMVSLKRLERSEAVERFERLERTDRS
jgi:hypothetical protein